MRNRRETLDEGGRLPVIQRAEGNFWANECLEKQKPLKFSRKISGLGYFDLVEPGDLNPFFAVAVDGLVWSTPLKPDLSAIPFRSLVAGIGK